jgi:hypothetical protein
MHKTFKHSGDLGDIIFSLPTIRALGGGILYLDPSGGKGTGDIDLGYKDHTNLNSNGINFLRPLLLAQDYIKEVVEWRGEKVDYNLDKFRNHVKYNNLAYSHLSAFNLPNKEADRKWLSNVSSDRPFFKNKFVISRTPKVQGNHEFWEFQVRKIKDKCVFVGLPKEHEIFEYALGYKVEYYQVTDALHLAECIASSGNFIGNQSMPESIAEGIKVSLICEVNKNYPAVIFKREGAVYV